MKDKNHVIKDICSYSSSELIRFLLKKVHFLENLLISKGNYSLCELEEAKERGDELMEIKFPSINNADIR